MGNKTYERNEEKDKVGEDDKLQKVEVLRDLRAIHLRYTPCV